MGKNYEKGLEEMRKFVDPVQGDMLLGAFRAVSEIKDAIVIINSPVGCHWGVNFIERLCSVKTNSAVSALRERNVIFGSDRNLRKTVEIFLKKRKNRYLILLAGNVPSIIGEDWYGIISSLEFDIDYIAIDCGGYLGKMGDGYEKSLKELINWIDEPERKNKKRPTLNLIGMPRDVPRGNQDIQEIKRCLKTIRIGINSIFPPQSIREVKRASNADLNIVFGYGKGLALDMQERWGIPYIYFDSYPYGINQTKKFLKKICDFLGINEYKKIQREEELVLRNLKKYYIYFPCIYEIPIAISADIFQARGLANFLTEELGMDIKALSVTSAPKGDSISDLKNLCKNLLFQRSWESFHDLLKKEDIKMIFGSDLEKRVATKDSLPFIPFAFPSTLQISLTEVPYMGFKGALTLTEIIMNHLLSYFS